MCARCASLTLAQVIDNHHAATWRARGALEIALDALDFVSSHQAGFGNGRFQSRAGGHRIAL